jgi:hypothetical protein
MVLDVLTPDALQLLGERLRAMPREHFTQESYIQIYQAKISLSQRVRGQWGLACCRLGAAFLLRVPVLDALMLPTAAAGAVRPCPSFRQAAAVALMDEAAAVAPARALYRPRVAAV